MTEKEWDDKFSQKITNLTDEIWIGSHSLKGLRRVEGKIFAVIRKDRKHQQSEMLKRLPRIGEIWKLLYGNSPIKSKDDKAPAIHKLVKDKLK